MPYITVLQQKAIHYSNQITFVMCYSYVTPNINIVPTELNERLVQALLGCGGGATDKQSRDKSWEWHKHCFKKKKGE